MGQDSDKDARVDTELQVQTGSEFGLADLMGSPTTAIASEREGATPVQARVGPGFVLASRLRLEQRIGKGGMGEVWRATHLSLGTPVAVKLIDPQLLDTPVARQRFAQEARAAASLRGTNVVQVLDHGVHEGLPYIVMELLEGETLAQRLAMRGKLEFEEALPLLADVCRAIARAHDLGLIHRDLKPANIFLVADEERERAKVLDFGVAKATEGEVALGASMTQTGVIVGTPYYMSPEQLRSSQSIDHRSDLWSFAVLTYECLTGTRPFQGRSVGDLAVQIHGGRAPAPSSVAQVPRGFDVWSDRALRVEPDERFADARTMLHALEQLADTQSSAPRGGQPREGADELEALLSRAEAQLESLRHAAARGALDAELARLSEFLACSSQAVEHLASRGVGEDESLALHALMLRGMASELFELLGTQARVDARGDWEGYRARLHGSVHAPLVRLLERESSAGSSSASLEGDDWLLDEGLELHEEPAERDWPRALLSSDELERHEALLALVDTERDAFATFLAAREASTRDPLLWQLWEAIPLLLLEGRKRAFKLFEVARRLADAEQLRARWARLLNLFWGHDSEDEDLEGIAASLEQETAADRELLHGVLVLHPSPRYRALALAAIEPHRLWDVIAHPKTPPSLLLEIWRAVEERVQRDFLKVFFVCVVDLLPRQRSAAHMRAALALHEAFYLVDCFHEDTLFRLLSELDESMRRAAAEHGLALALDDAHAQRVAAFFAEGPRQDRPIESWTRVPLPVQRRLARRGAFLRYFVTHPVAAIAMECVPHLLVLPEVIEFFELRTIHPKVLERLARETRFVRKEVARLALVANPKSSARVVSRYLPTLRADSLRKLANARSASNHARELARRRLQRKR